MSTRGLRPSPRRPALHVHSREKAKLSANQRFAKSLQRFCTEFAKSLTFRTRKRPPISPVKGRVRSCGNQHRSWGNRISATTSWGADCCMKVPLRGHDRSPIPTKGRLFICSAPSWGTLIINNLPRSDMGSNGRTTYTLTLPTIVQLSV